MNYSALSRPAIAAALVFLAAPLLRAQAGPCGDPWINQIYTQKIGRAPVGSGKNVGECNIMLYSNGNWKNFGELQSDIVAYHAAHPNPPAAAATTSTTQVMLHLDRNWNVDDPRGNVIATKGTYSIISQDGNGLTDAQIAAIVAAGGGNIILNGGGNIILNAGGNYKLQSVGRPVFKVLR